MRTIFAMGLVALALVAGSARAQLSGSEGLAGGGGTTQLGALPALVARGEAELRGPAVSVERCRALHRSFEIRNRMSPSQRKQAEAACIATARGREPIGVAER